MQLLHTATLWLYHGYSLRYRYRYIYDFSRSHSYFVWERCSALCLGPQLPLEHSP